MLWVDCSCELSPQAGQPQLGPACWQSVVQLISAGPKVLVEKQHGTGALDRTGCSSLVSMLTWVNISATQCVDIMMPTLLFLHIMLIIYVYFSEVFN